MRFVPARISGAVVIELDVRLDDRGTFVRTFCEREFADAGIPFRVVQANLSLNSKPLTLRGMHLQRHPHGEAKIVSCSRGRIYDVAADLRPDSETYLRWDAVELSPEHARMFYIPEGVAHGYLTLEPDSEVNYLMGAAYVAEAADGVRWDDPSLGIEWPAEPSFISERDRSFPPLKPAA
jgi:dTDP-4-dehydrorhamnose 3,5-epimerase